MPEPKRQVSNKPVAPATKATLPAKTFIRKSFYEDFNIISAKLFSIEKNNNQKRSL